MGLSVFVDGGWWRINAVDDLKRVMWDAGGDSRIC